MTNTILITGGLGYVGGRIAKFFSENTDYKLKISTRQNAVQAPAWLKNGEIVKLDLLDAKDVEAACEGVNYLIHLAAMNEIESSKNPELSLGVNGLGSLKLLHVAEKVGVKRFIYFSTAHVYGSPLKGIITEKILPRPSHPYAVTHRIAEDFVLAAHDRKTLTGIVLRLSNGFGVPIRPDVDRWTLVVNDLCRQVVTKGKMILRSSGLQWRDFITLEDVSRSVLHFLNLPADRCADGLFNLGGGHSYRIIDMAELIGDRCREVLGFSPPIVRPESQSNEYIEDLNYRIDKLGATGFSLKSNFNEEIEATLSLCKQFI